MSLVADRIPPEIRAEAQRLNARVRRGKDYRLGDMRTRGARYLARERRKAIDAGKPWNVLDVWAARMLAELPRETFLAKFLRGARR